MAMKDQIIEVVRNLNGSVSFVELSNQVEGFKGDYEMRLPEHNVVLWSGMSEAAIQAISELRRTNRLIAVPASWLTYAVDGMMLKYPIAKSKRKYKTPRWVPMAFSLPEQMRPSEVEKWKTNFPHESGAEL